MTTARAQKSILQHVFRWCQFFVMASKAYVASMTVTELKQELKQRGLSTRGSKKSLRDRLERAFDEEELSDSSSESESARKMDTAEAGFNFSVPAESFLPADQIREDSPVPSPNSEKMIISVELSNKETLEVYSPKPPTARDDGGGGGGGVDGPLVVAVSVPNDDVVMSAENHNSIPAVNSVAREGEVGHSENAPAIATNNEHSVLVSAVNDQTVRVTVSDETGKTLLADRPPVESCVSDKTDGGGDAVEKVCGEDTRRGGSSGDGGVGEGTVGEVRVDEDGGGESGDKVEGGVGEGAVNMEGEARVDEEGRSESGDKVEGGVGEGAVNMEGEVRVGEEGRGESGDKLEGGVGEEAVDMEDKMRMGEEKICESGDKVEGGVGEGVQVEVGVGEGVQVEGGMGKEEEDENTVSKTDLLPTEKEMAAEIESNESVKLLKAHPPEVETAEERMGEGEEATSAVEGREDDCVNSHVEPQASTPSVDTADQTNITEQAKEGSTEEWVIVERQSTEEQREGNVTEEVTELVADVASSEVKQEVSKAPQEEGEETMAPLESAEIDSETVCDTTPPVDMEVEEKTDGEKCSPPSDEAASLNETEKEEVQEPSPDAPSTAVLSGEDSTVSVAAPQSRLISPDEQAASDSTQPAPSLPSPIGPPENKSNPARSGTLGPAAAPNEAPVTVTEEVSEGVSMEVAVLVHAEEDDLSVFSTEAAEAQKLASSREKEQGKVREKVRDRERDKDKSRHHRTSGSSVSNSASSNQQSSARAVEEGVGSYTSNRSSSEVAPAATVESSPLEETRHGDGGRTEGQAEQPSRKRRRISAHASSTAEPASIQWGGGGEKKRRWGSGKQRSSSSTANISSDILKDIIPSELEVGEGEGVMEGEGDSVLGEMYGERGIDEGQEQMELNEKDEHQIEWEEKVREREAKQREAERARQELETRQRIEARVRARQEQAEAKAKEVEKDTGKSGSQSPARNPPSHILHIENMTRPFTLVQLKQLLSEDGPLLKEGFWTNNIKSHCIAVYASKEVAASTRRRLHGMKWPSTNPKLLAVDFLSPEQVQKISQGDLVVMEAAPEVGGKEEEEEERGEGVVGDGVKNEGGESGVGGEGGEGVTEEKGAEVGSEDATKKERGESEGQEKTEKEQDKKEEPKNELSDKVARGESGDVKTEMTTDASAAPVQERSSQATQLLDDLFRKTKATPSVYWLPLSEAQVEQKQKEREAREAEREKRRLERQKVYEEERKREKEREELARKERERRIQEERDRRAKDRVRRRSRDRNHSRSRSRSRSYDRHRDRRGGR